jgi:glycolate oxidase FAD binding subunit
MTALDHFVDRVRAAAADGQPLRIRGGGTKDFYGERLQGEVLDTGSLGGIVNYEPSELVVTVRAGTLLSELEAALAQKHQSLAFDPPHFGPGATVGGMVASGLAGPSRAAVGSVRDFMLGAQIVNGRGEVLRFGGQVMKNVAGYDVSRLMAGSLGTLALITEVSLKVLPLAPAEATLKFAMDEARMIEQLNRWGGQPLPLNASSWLREDGQPVLYLRLRGAVAAVQSACERLLRELPGQRLDNAQVAADWHAAREVDLPWFRAGFARGDALWRLSVPQTTPPLNLGDTLIDWLGAQRWVFVPATDIEAAQRLRLAARTAGGSATLWRVPSAHKPMRLPVFDELRAPLDRIHKALKQEFDPAGIFNPGRMSPDF